MYKISTRTWERVREKATISHQILFISVWLSFKWAHCIGKESKKPFRWWISVTIATASRPVILYHIKFLSFSLLRLLKINAFPKTITVFFCFSIFTSFYWIYDAINCTVDSRSVLRCLNITFASNSCWWVYYWQQSIYCTLSSSLREKNVIEFVFFKKKK